MAADLPLPKTIISHGHWLISGSKMSKSKGNAIDVFSAIENHGSDPLRFFLLKFGNLGDDGGKHSSFFK